MNGKSIHFITKNSKMNVTQCLTVLKCKQNQKPYSTLQPKQTNKLHIKTQEIQPNIITRQSWMLTDLLSVHSRLLNQHESSYHRQQSKKMKLRKNKLQRRSRKYVLEERSLNQIQNFNPTIQRLKKQIKVLQESQFIGLELNKSLCSQEFKSESKHMNTECSFRGDSDIKGSYRSFLNDRINSKDRGKSEMGFLPSTSKSQIPGRQIYSKSVIGNFSTKNNCRTYSMAKKYFSKSKDRTTFPVEELKNPHSRPFKTKRNRVFLIHS